MPNPWVSLICDQLIQVNKAVNKKEQLEKGVEEEETLSRRHGLRLKNGRSSVRVPSRL
jgi:hypothetical protein